MHNPIINIYNSVCAYVFLKELLLGVWTDNRDKLGSVSCILSRTGRCSENVWIKVHTYTLYLPDILREKMNTLQ